MAGRERTDTWRGELMFRIIFFSSWTLLHFYVFWRLASISFVSTRVSRTVLIVAALVLWAVGILQRYMDDIGLEALEQPVELFVLNWLGVLFIVFCCVFIVDVITLFGLVLRQYAPILRSAAFVVGVSLAALAFIQGVRAPVVTDYEVNLPRLRSEHEGLVVAVISDTHLGGLITADWLAARAAQINAMQPDMVLLVGDLFEGDYEEERQDEIRETLRSLRAPLGIWAVTGNHEMYGGVEATVRFLESAGVKMLRNEWAEIAPGLAVGGIDDGVRRESREAARDRILGTFRSMPSDAATIFLSHRPQLLEEAAEAGVGLMLSGHTHGGQIWPFSYLVGMANPIVEGDYLFGDMTAIVTRGAGTWGPRMRLWLPGEILRIVLRPERDNPTAPTSHHH